MPKTNVAIRLRSVSECEHQEIAHHTQVLFDIGGDSERSREHRSTQVDDGPGFADSLLDLANARQVFIQLATVGGPQIFREASGIFGDKIEDALLPPIATGAGLCTVTLGRAAEEPVEHQPGIDLLGNRCRFASPCQI